MQHVYIEDTYVYEQEGTNLKSFAHFQSNLKSKKNIQRQMISDSIPSFPDCVTDMVMTYVIDEHRLVQTALKSISVFNEFSQIEEGYILFPERVDKLVFVNDSTICITTTDGKLSVWNLASGSVETIYISQFQQYDPHTVIHVYCGAISVLPSSSSSSSDFSLAVQMVSRNMVLLGFSSGLLVSKVMVPNTKHVSKIMPYKHLLICSCGDEIKVVDSRTAQVVGEQKEVAYNMNKNLDFLYEEKEEGNILFGRIMNTTVYMWDLRDISRIHVKYQMDISFLFRTYPEPGWYDCFLFVQNGQSIVLGCGSFAVIFPIQSKPLAESDLVYISGWTVDAWIIRMVALSEKEIMLLLVIGTPSRKLSYYKYNLETQTGEETGFVHTNIHRDARCATGIINLLKESAKQA